MNYNELFNLFYSNLPESVKISILDKIPSDFITEELNESSSEIGAYVELLDTLAYSSVSEATVESIIDEVFSSLSADVTEEILEAYVREKVIQYIVEADDPIGLAGIRKQREESIKNRLKDRARKQAFNRFKSNVIHKGAELSKKAVTGAREATQKAISKGAELSKKAVRKGAELSQKANDIRNTMANKAGEVKNKAVSGIKNAVSKVRDWAKKVGKDDSPIGLSQIIGRKALENEKTGKSNFGDQVKTTTSSNTSANKANATTNAIKANANKTKVAQEVGKNKPAEVKAEAPKANKEVKKVKSAKAKKEKEIKAEVKKEEPKVEQQKLNLEKAKQKVKKEQQPKAKKAEKVEAKKEAEVKPVEAEKTEVKPVESKIKVKNIYTSHGDMKPSEKEQAKKAKVETMKKAKARNEEAKPVETPKIEAVKKAKGKVEEKPEAKKEEPKKKMTEFERFSKKLDIEKKQRQEGKITSLKRDIDLIDKEIVGAEGKPSMMARLQDLRKRKEEIQSKLRELEAQPAHEALADLACLLAKTNISEEAFVEIMTMTNPIKKKENRKKRFEEIAKKRFKKD